MGRIAGAQVHVWEVVLVSSLIALLAYAWIGSGREYVHSGWERDYFRRTYGPHRYSEGVEEWVIRDFFKDRRGGTFVDVGANHYRNSSKTYYLERHLGWSGLAVEPQREFAAGYAEHRPRTRFLPYFASSPEGRTATLYVNRDNRSVASSTREFVSLFGPIDEAVEVPAVTLTELLEQQGMQSFDFLSMDIELHEPQALSGFDIERFKPELVCIEALLPVRQKILDYFARHGYVVVGRYVWVDRENLYFTPAGEP